MMNTPCSRARFTTALMRGAISATRRVAPSHQCLSHMSQMTRAVFFGSHEMDFSTICHSLESELERTRARVSRVRRGESSAADVPRQIRSKAAVRSEEHTSELQSRLHLVCRLLLE